ncbi:chloroplast stem-loop binding protein of 41 kDa b, chloroplastic [Tanacetum coccineum]
MFCSILCLDYVVEPNLIVDERNTDPSLPTREFKRVYVCLGALKLDFRACKRDLLCLDGAFMNGPFPGQVLPAIGLDSNNGIYPLAYALVEAESKSSWCWFLQCLGDDIDLHPNSNFTFISDRQKGIILTNKIISASATSVKEFEKCMSELKKMNPKAHEWLNKIAPDHWARSYFLGRAKFDLLLNNICEVFNAKIVRGKDKPVITLLEYIRKYCMKRIVNVQSVIDKYTGPLTPTTTRILESIKKEAHFMKVQWNVANMYQVSGGNNAEASGSISRQSQQTDLAVSQDGSSGSSVGAIIGLFGADGQGGTCGPGGVGGVGVGVGSQCLSRTRWTKRRVQRKRISPQKGTLTQPATQPSTNSQVPVTETRNADER